ncbi:hypothetical protein NNJEOMEG_03688 [Fundidesulfovibrio magnetotacticus]|uniref:AB hydrolase-1 domain-containing protein n=1 Tax=Fundidesulfovibrio magnetotacticus TaxID=2730080 RepID=A0A6V8M1V3_9BACT|nr:alpha/beta fold hydrolase [Fundidesulfovibrio magnetotacticus]GFK95817.1 hypothetical protein NNJEOMEG_03688 [Fundidesulfovibrio magnetotacticus]
MFVTALSILLILAACIAGLTYAVYWHEARREPHPALLESMRCNGGLLRCAAMGFFSSFASVLTVILANPLALARGLWRPAPDPGCARPPVLLVHGLYHNASAWWLYRLLLRRRGYVNVFAWDYDTLGGDFEDLAQRLSAAVRELSARCGGERVVLVGHSLGGLLTRAVLADPAAVACVRAAVVLGVPNRGSVLAALAVGSLGRSLRPDGRTTRCADALNAPLELPKLNVYSPLDNMVVPTSSLEIPEPGWTQRRTAPIGHAGMLYHTPTARMVLDFLEAHAGNCERKRPGAARLEERDAMV